MEKYRIPVCWMMKGYVETPCNNLKSAVDYALHPDTPLPKDRDYVEGSLSLDIGQLYADARATFPDSDAVYFQELLDKLEKKRARENYIIHPDEDDRND